MGDALRDADDEGDLCLDGLDDGVGGERRRDIDDSRFRLELVVGLSRVRVGQSAFGAFEDREREGEGRAPP